jgi:hypothetical protein
MLGWAYLVSLDILFQASFGFQNTDVHDRVYRRDTIFFPLNPDSLFKKSYGVNNKVVCILTYLHMYHFHSSSFFPRPKGANGDFPLRPLRSQSKCFLDGAYQLHPFGHSPVQYSTPIPLHVFRFFDQKVHDVFFIFFPINKKKEVIVLNFPH